MSELNDGVQSKLETTPSGIGGLDEVTGGGQPAGRPTLVCGGPGSGKTLVGLSFLVNGVRQFGEPGVLVSFEESAAELASDLPSLGFDLPGLIAKCMRAFTNLKRICEEHLVDRYRIEIIDLLQNPQLARGDQILAVPTLVRQLPEPVKKTIGDLSNTERPDKQSECTATPEGTGTAPELYDLCLYVTGMTPHSVRAIENRARGAADRGTDTGQARAAAAAGRRSVESGASARCPWTFNVSAPV